jgi:RNA polymerase sigma factor (sigma-70 family)
MSRLRNSLRFHLSSLTRIAAKVWLLYSPRVSAHAEKDSEDLPPVEAGLFEATHWSLIILARDSSGAALGKLCESYRQPLLVWLKNRNYTSHDAEDLLQGFFLQLLDRNFLNSVAQDKGKFRTFLLKCLKNYLNDQHDKFSAAKRGAGKALASLDETADGLRVYEPAGHEASPDLEYDRAWARTVLRNAVTRLERDCARQGHQALYSALQPVMLADENAAPYREIGQTLGMTETAVKTAAHRIRIRLRGLIREEVLHTITNEQDLEQEVRYLIELFAR